MPFNVESTYAPLDNNKARVFFYRDHAYVNRAVWAGIKVNGEYIAKSYDSSVISKVLPAGNYDFYIASPSFMTPGRTHIPLRIDGGQTYFVEISANDVPIVAGNTYVTVHGSSSAAPVSNIHDCGGGFCAAVLSSQQAIPRMSGLIDIEPRQK